MFPSVAEIVSKHSTSVPQRSTDGTSSSKPKRAFDMARYRQRKIALQVQYNGDAYLGFAAQAPGDADETVEKHLFAALTKVRLIEDRQQCGYSRCGRTDKGVSALGQVVALRVRSAFPLSVPSSNVPLHPNDSLAVDAKEVVEIDYCSLLNRTLPSDIRVLGWTEVSDGFSARFSASYRTYRYFFVRRSLDIDAMNAAATRLIGVHDFRNLSKLDVANVSNFVREVICAEVRCVDDSPSCAASMYMLEIAGANTAALVAARVTGRYVCRSGVSVAHGALHRRRAVPRGRGQRDA